MFIPLLQSIPGTQVAVDAAASSGVDPVLLQFFGATVGGGLLVIALVNLYLTSIRHKLEVRLMQHKLNELSALAPTSSPAPTSSDNTSSDTESGDKPLTMDDLDPDGFTKMEQDSSEQPASETSDDSGKDRSPGGKEEFDWDAAKAAAKAVAKEIDWDEVKSAADVSLTWMYRGFAFAGIGLVAGISIAAAIDALIKWFSR